MPKTLLVDIDSIWGSLPLMHIATDRKAKGYEVSLVRMSKDHTLSRKGKNIKLRIDSPWSNFDEAFISCLFSWNKDHALSVGVMLRSMGVPKVEIGGSGVDLKKELPIEMRNNVPDYSIYNLDYSMGFITRGCDRCCPWCIVYKKEGRLRLDGTFNQILYPGHNKLILMDNNLLLHPDHPKILQGMIDRNLQVSFNQGLDIRCITYQNAALLAKIKCRDAKFNVPRLYFSWDTLGIEREVAMGISKLNDAGVPSSQCFFYVLCGFNVSKVDYTWDYFLKNDWYRFQAIRNFGAKAFIMKYNRRKDIPLLNAFSRWVNFMYKARKKELGDMGSFISFLNYEYPKIHAVPIEKAPVNNLVYYWGFKP